MSYQENIIYVMKHNICIFFAHAYWHDTYIYFNQILLYKYW